MEDVHTPTRDPKTRLRIYRAAFLMSRISNDGEKGGAGSKATHISKYRIPCEYCIQQARTTARTNAKVIKRHQARKTTHTPLSLPLEHELAPAQALRGARPFAHLDTLPTVQTPTAAPPYAVPVHAHARAPSPSAQTRASAPQSSAFSSPASNYSPPSSRCPRHYYDRGSWARQACPRSPRRPCRHRRARRGSCGCRRAPSNPSAYSRLSASSSSREDGERVRMSLARSSSGARWAGARTKAARARAAWAGAGAAGSATGATPTSVERNPPTSRSAPGTVVAVRFRFHSPALAWPWP